MRGCKPIEAVAISKIQMIRCIHTSLMLILAVCIMPVSGCGSQSAIRLTISEDSKLVPTQVDRIEVRITIYSRDGDHTRQWGDYIIDSLPQTIVVNKGGQYDLGAKFWVDGFKDDRRRIVKYKSAAFPSGGVKNIEIVLDSSCLDRECEPNSHCESGDCLENTDPIEFPEVDADEEDEVDEPDMDEEDIEAEDLVDEEVDDPTDDLADAAEVIDALEEEVIDAMDMEAEEAVEDPGEEDPVEEEVVDAPLDPEEEELIDAPPDPVEDEIIEDVMDAEDLEEEEAGCPPGPPLVGVESIASGAKHTCALMTDGSVKCWGLNDSGQLGNGTTENSAVPVDVAGLGDSVSKIAMGHHHGCAIMETSGALKCWGFNDYGQLGFGDIGDRSTPVDVTGLASGVISAAAGENHTCAVLTGGAVKCWGLNLDGQLGLGHNDHRYTPGSVDLSTDSAESVSAGQNHTCVKIVGGGIRCWGNNSHGQLGDGTTVNSNVPVAVEIDASEDPLLGIETVACGGWHTCALTDTGGVKCWGYGHWGQLGIDISPDDYRLYPVDVTGLSSGMNAVSCRNHHSCAIVEASGAVKCWGYNGLGQLGDGTPNNRTEPVSVDGLTTAAVISLGKYHTCAALGSGQAACWGQNGEDGRLGNGETGGEYLIEYVPVTVINCD